MGKTEIHEAENAKSCSNLDNSCPKQKIKNKKRKNISPILPKIKKFETETGTESLLKIDEMFRNRWHIEGLIGKGGYGEIYLAIDMNRAEEVAIKVEPQKRQGKLARRMILEQKILVTMQGKPHVPMIFASGRTDKNNFIVMQLLSINLGEIRKASPVENVSRGTTGRILLQAIGALRDLHEIGYVHRDVKPANMCFGINRKNRHVLYLLDFGLIRRFKTETGERRRAREKAGFRGTNRYVSLRVHSRLEQTPADDMESLLYTAHELLIGDLPWKYLESNIEIKQNKILMRFEPSKYFTNPDLLNFAEAIYSLDPQIDPPYTKLQEILTPLIGDKKLDDPYDWEEQYYEAIDEYQLSDESSE
ncbi:unnamed protein product [Caenorhabditis angaria]|uniref:non-specific serine/threonine protein kinase n=1 Tax=Caenorhabditis angaria TaxID=860376 RepID=A0A9P1IAM0_9PELO|nr:unnamed protein product [Caenorhabditis angaria]